MPGTSTYLVSLKNLSPVWFVSLWLGLQGLLPIPISSPLPQDVSLNISLVPTTNHHPTPIPSRPAPFVYILPFITHMPHADRLTIGINGPLSRFPRPVFWPLLHLERPKSYLRSTYLVVGYQSQQLSKSQIHHYDNPIYLISITSY